MTNREKLFFFIIVIYSISLIYCFISLENKITSKELQVERSRGRVEQLTKDLDKAKLELDLLIFKKDSLYNCVLSERESRNKVKIVYYEKKNSIVTLSLDSSIKYCSKWLSEADTLRR